MARFNMRYAARVVELLAGVGQRGVRQPVPAGRAARPTRRSVDRGPPSRCTCPYDEALGINPQDDKFLECESWDFDRHAGREVPAAAALPPARDLPPPGAQAGRRRAGDGRCASDQFPLDSEAPQLRLLRPDHDRRLVAVGVRAGDGGGPDRLRRAGRRVLPRGAVRRPRRHPRQRQRRRARRFRPAACGAPSCSGSPGSTTRARRCGSTPSLPTRVAGRHVPHAAARLADDRRSRRRRLHRRRARRRRRCRSR